MTVISQAISAVTKLGHGLSIVENPMTILPPGERTSAICLSTSRYSICQLQWTIQPRGFKAYLRDLLHFNSANTRYRFVQHMAEPYSHREIQPRLRPLSQILSR